jgi:hypothetical protein
MERIEVNCVTGEKRTIQLTAGEIALAQSYTPVVKIPTLNRRQAKLYLLQIGILDDVEALITTPTTKIWWNDTAVFERDHPLVNQVLTALNKSSAQIDEMFIQAALL